MGATTTQFQLEGKGPVFIAFVVLFLLSACAKNPSWSTVASVDASQVLNNADSVVTPIQPEVPVDATAGHTPISFKAEPLAWESASHPERQVWSAFAMRVVDEEFESLDQAQDANLFCPTYDRLSREQKTNFWAQLIAGMSYYESGWSPVSRMQETSLGTDSVTGKPVYSEGLLQLSYQDIRGYSFCEFDWNKDKNLSSKDPQKSILDPFKNLRCGIKILSSQLARKKEIVVGNGVYWAVIRKGSSHISQIASLTKRLSFCR